MLYLNKTLKHLNFIFIFIFYVGFVYSCSIDISEDPNNYLEVETNGILVYKDSSYSDVNIAYIIEDSELYISFYLNNNGVEDCYTKDSTSSSASIFTGLTNEEPFKINNIGSIVEVIFYKNLATTSDEGSYNLPLYMNVTFTSDGESLKYNFDFREDIISPSINKFGFGDTYNGLFLSYEDSNSYLIKKDSNYLIEYETQDLESGVKIVSFSNLDETNIERTLEKISSDSEEIISGTIEDSFSSDTIISITSQDLLGNSNISEIDLEIDSTAPEMIEQSSNFDVIYNFNDMISSINFEVIFEDQTYEIFGIDEIFNTNTEDNFKLNISQLNPNNVADIISPDSCIKNQDSINRISCSYIAQIETFEEEVEKTISFTTNDYFGNTEVESLNLAISTDLEPPNILDFYVESNIGEQDWISSSSSFEPQDSIVFLRFRDEDINNQEDINEDTVSANFDDLKDGLGGEGSCFYIEGNVECTWILVNEKENNIQNELSSKNDEDLELIVEIKDSNNNIIQETANVSVDNIFPEIIDLNFTFSDEVFGTVQNLQTGLSPIFRLYLNDSDFDNESNLEENVVKDLVFVDFSKISDEDDPINPEECSYDIDENYWVCEFEEITITSEDSDYVYIEVYDKAGNLATENKELQVYGTIEDYEVLKYDPKVELFNSVDRNLAYSTDFKVLYKVTLENESDKSFRLLYANMLPDTCSWLNRSEILELDGVITAEDLEDIDIVEDDYFSITDERYPRMIGLGYHLVEDDGTFNDSEYRDFYVEFEFLKHENFADLINNGIRCNISIVKRDNLDIYGPEIHELNFLVGFTGELENTIIYNKAEKLLGEIEDNRALALNTQTLREAHDGFKKLCGAVTEINGIVGIAATAWTPISLIMHSWGGASVGEVDKFMYGTQGWFSDMVFGIDPITKEGNWFNTVCNFVTCAQQNKVYSEWISTIQGSSWCAGFGSPDLNPGESE